MNNKTIFSFSALVFIFNISAAELTINLSGQSKAGVLSLALYSDPELYDYSVKGEKRDESGVFAGIESFIEPQKIHKFVINIPDGKYAIALFIDKNKNNKIDKNFIGIPKEQFGFSNNAMGKLSAPSFQQAMFEVAGDTIQNIELK